MSEGSSRLSITAAVTALAIVTPWSGDDVARAQFFPGFGAPQQINTPRGAFQLAPGWRVATTPIRTSQGYRVAVRSDAGEQRNMLIGNNGALAVGRAYEPTAARPRPRASQFIERAPRRVEAPKPKVKFAAIRPASKPTIAAPAHPKAAPANFISRPSPTAQPTPLPKDTSPKLQPPTPIGPQAPGYAHGVPINPLD